MGIQSISNETGEIAPVTNPKSKNPNDLVKSERKILGTKQSTLKLKVKKMTRLTEKKADLKQTLKRGYKIVMSKLQKEGEDKVELKKTHPSLTTIDRLQIKDEIKGIDLQLFDVKAQIKNLKEVISSKRHKSITAKRAKLQNKKIEYAEKLKKAEAQVEESQQKEEVDELITQLKDELSVEEKTSHIDNSQSSGKGTTPEPRVNRLAYLDGPEPEKQEVPNDHIEQKKVVKALNN